MQAASFDRFYKTLEMIYPVVKQMLDDQCERAKDELKSKPDDEIGSFKKAVTSADGVWMTRGHHSQNFSGTTSPMRYCITSTIVREKTYVAFLKVTFLKAPQRLQKGTLHMQLQRERKMMA